jgi:hypothetical protein
MSWCVVAFAILFFLFGAQGCAVYFALSVPLSSATMLREVFLYDWQLSDFPLDFLRSLRAGLTWPRCLVGIVGIKLMAATGARIFTLRTLARLWWERDLSKLPTGERILVVYWFRRFGIDTSRYSPDDSSI